MPGAAARRRSGPDEGPDRISELLRDSTAEDVDRGTRAKALAALIPPLAASARQAGFRAVTAGRWLVDEVVDLAPRLAFRDAPTLRRQHPGLTDEQIAELLIVRARRTTAAIGAAAGAVSAAEFVAPPALLATPVQLAAELLAVTAVELKLVAELHVIMGHPLSGSAAEQASGYLMSWVHRSAARSSAGGFALAEMLSDAAKRELRSRVLRRLGRGTTTLAPFLAGAVAGAEVNRRATRDLGQAILAELRERNAERWFRPV